MKHQENLAKKFINDETTSSTSNSGKATNEEKIE